MGTEVIMRPNTVSKVGAGNWITPLVRSMQRRPYTMTATAMKTRKLKAYF